MHKSSILIKELQSSTKVGWWRLFLQQWLIKGKVIEVLQYYQLDVKLAWLFNFTVFTVVTTPFIKDWESCLLNSQKLRLFYCHSENVGIRKSFCSCLVEVYRNIYKVKNFLVKMAVHLNHPKNSMPDRLQFSLVTVFFKKFKSKW